jgi:hypothetical protein
MREIIPPTFNRPSDASPGSPHYLKFWISDVGPGIDLLACVWRMPPYWKYRFRYRQLTFPAHEIRYAAELEAENDSAVIESLDQMIADSGTGPARSYPINGGFETACRLLNNDKELSLRAISIAALPILYIDDPNEISSAYENSGHGRLSEDYVREIQERGKVESSGPGEVNFWILNIMIVTPSHPAAHGAQ